MDKMKRIVALILAVLIVLSVASYLFYAAGEARESRPEGGLACGPKPAASRKHNRRCKKVCMRAKK